MTTFFNDTITKVSTRLAATHQAAHILLDKNEQTEDVGYAYKLKVLNKLMDCDWNRYPELSHADIEVKVAQYCHLAQENIALSSGSANMITCLLNYFGLNKKNLIIAQPTYSLFDYHCKTYNIPYTPWLLNEDLQFDYESLPDMNEHSVLIITSPNNPTGNSIDAKQLEFLLTAYSSSLIIVDGVYTEFAEEDITYLIKTYSNFMVLRSFSKAFPAAGIRLGYLCANASIVATMKKLLLPFSINPFAICFASEVLFEPEFQQRAKNTGQEIIYQRELLAYKIQKHFDKKVVRVFPSQGNFLLIRVQDPILFDNLMNDFSESGIKVLNTSKFVLLENSFRVSIGTEYENEEFFQCLSSSMSNSFIGKELVEAAGL